MHWTFKGFVRTRRAILGSLVGLEGMCIFEREGFWLRGLCRNKGRCSAARVQKVDACWLRVRV